MDSVDVDAAREHYRRREARRREQREAGRQRWLERVRQAVSRLAADHPGARRVYVFGSLVKAGQFRADSDIDLAVECDTLESESAFWRTLKQALERDVDVRPLSGTIAEVAAREGELVYGRKDPCPDQ